MTASQVRSRASFQTRLLLHLANRRKQRGGLGSGAAEAFTLVELMIVVAILGILAAVALPNFLQSRDAATVSSRVSEALAIAKQCSVYKSTGVGTQPTKTGNIDSVTCDTTTADGTVVTKWTSGAAGVKCLTDTSVADDTQATITVKADIMECSFG